MKQNIPWPIKFATKLMLGATGIDYRVLKRLRIVEHGRMEQAAFAREIFELHVASPLRRYSIAPAGTLLEIGPGDSVATGVLGRAAGYAAVQLVDAGCFADLRARALDRLFVALGAEAMGLSEDTPLEEVRSRLSERGIHYHTAGTASLARIGTGMVGYSFSNTVLQHVHREELPLLIEELGRVHASGSFSSHSVNFTDHFSGGFLNQRLPQKFIESSLIKRANLYTNRVSSHQYLDLFAAAGFRVRHLTVDFFGPHVPQRAEYATASEFRAGVEDARILRIIFFLQKS